MSELRVLVFGSTGVGKTSLCNALTDQRRPVSDSARGVTFDSYTYTPVEFEGKTLIITDTVGLNETDNGAVTSRESLEGLIQLIKEAKHGYNLLIQVTNSPRITRSLRDDYDFFVNEITQRKIPTILVRTGAENTQPMSSWAEKNKPEFEKDNLIYQEVIAATFAIGSTEELEKIYSPLRQESISTVINSIQEKSTSEPQKIYIDDDAFMDTVRRAYNKLIEILGLPEKLRMEVNETVYDILVKAGVPEEMAKKLKDNETIEKAAKFAWKRIIDWVTT